MGKKVKLMIEIGEEEYEIIKTLIENTVIQNLTVSREFLEAISNGTPYNPSGDAISRSDLKKEVVGMMINKADDLEEVEFEINATLASVCEKIDNAQAIPLPNEQIAWEQGFAAGLAQGKQQQKGEWYYNYQNGWHCSICHKSVKDMPTVMGKANFAFCPNCGADMRKGDAE